MTPTSFTEHDARIAVRCALEEREGWRYVETTHAKERMAERSITTLRVRRVLRSGRIEEGPAPGDRGGWKCTFVGTADDTVAVVVAFEFDDEGGATLVVTAYRTGTH